MRPAQAWFGSLAGAVGGLVVGWLGSPWPTQAAEPSRYDVQWKSEPDTPGRAVVEIVGMDGRTLHALQQPEWPPAAWPTLLAVHAAKGGDDGPVDPSVPAMLGRYSVSVEEGKIRFQPQFSLERGVTYRAVFRPAALPGAAAATAAEITTSFRLPPGPKQAATVVTEIYPSGPLLPENLLKFYLHFSAPMQRGRIYEHIHLLGEDRKPVELPFLELDEELWNPEMTRLTLFIDPGRIKRGVTPLEEIGPALEAGKRYLLVIDATWLDSLGRPLQQSFRKSFRVGAPDREPPDPAGWKITPPKPGSRDPLSVRFSGPMDCALALRMLRVADATGAAVEGTGALLDHEERWTFTPQKAWRSGAHQLRVQKIIEDLAGNNIGKAFEVDVFEKVEPRFMDEVVHVAFQVQ